MLPVAVDGAPINPQIAIERVPTGRLVISNRLLVAFQTTVSTVRPDTPSSA